MVVVFIWRGSWVRRGSNHSMGLAVAWRFLVSRSTNDVAIEVEVSGFLDRRSVAWPGCRISLGARFGGSHDGGAVAWVKFWSYLGGSYLVLIWLRF